MHGPGFVRRHAGNLTDRDVRLWRAVVACVIAAEIALPPALLIEQMMPYSVVAGTGMHAAFTCLTPRQLITFSGLTVGAYIAFAAA
ncbi:hypothetical protein ADL00_09995 [Streptomyces sp. AS58]|uniref:hypothetical protein n=1 Tax=Streptomyces sp. AS58 TaxID=1519489 RepID=UPI0006AED84B|nr:hypothetical protein [Streptomyces sp. AS58]KOV70054.1 hypothetical protein ADL00_09995 [Streptomyces sp. AS58]